VYCHVAAHNLVVVHSSQSSIKFVCALSSCSDVLVCSVLLFCSQIDYLKECSDVYFYAMWMFVVVMLDGAAMFFVASFF
jgi:hypothetical protein